MGSSVRRIFWLVATFTVALGVALGTSRDGTPGVGARDSCPDGQIALSTVGLADLALPSDLPPGTTIQLSKVTIAPGESIEQVPSGYSAYYVESGVMKYQFQPWLTIVSAPKCLSGDGRFSGGGTTTISEDDMVVVNTGEALTRYPESDRAWRTLR